MTSETNIQPSSQSVVVKLHLETDFDTFVAQDQVTRTLAALAGSLGIPVEDIAFLGLRRGCVILVMSLPEEAAQRLLSISSASTEDGILRELVTQLKISRVTEGDSIEKAGFLRLRGADFEPDLCWLHLSDLHMTSDYKDKRSDTYADLDRFLEDLPKCLNEFRIVPDATFFTGDVSQSGSEDEYEAAQEFFADLQQVLPDASRLAPMFIVPGNHDITWSEIDIAHELELRNRLRASTKPEEILEEYADYIKNRQRNFSHFIEKLESTLANPTLDGFSFISSFRPSRNIRVGVAGLNSSWLSTRKDLYKSYDKLQTESLADLDLQHLWLGSKQLREAAFSSHMENANIRIALMHHEPLSEWYAESDRLIQRQELSRYDFVLRGHQHEARARVGAKVAGADDFVELAPGALRTKPHWYQGFMTTELNLRGGQMRLRAWSVTGLARRWVPDPEFGNGGVELRLLSDRLKLLH